MSCALVVLATGANGSKGRTALGGRITKALTAGLESGVSSAEF